MTACETTVPSGSDAVTTIRTDEELMQAYRAGTVDREYTVAELFARFQSRVARWCLRFTQDRELARDLTQEFFCRLLAKDYLQVVQRDKGRFRTFLRLALKRFLANDWDRRRAQKRGGAQTHLSLEAGLAANVRIPECGSRRSPGRRPRRPCRPRPARAF